MTLNEYQELANRTRNQSELEVLNYTLGLAGETGEFVEAIKKMLFHGHHTPPEKIKEELGDILWYVATLTSIFDFELSDVGDFNIKKLAKRYPEKFSTEHSENRLEYEPCPSCGRTERFMTPMGAYCPVCKRISEV